MFAELIVDGPGVERQLEKLEKDAFAAGLRAHQDGKIPERNLGGANLADVMQCQGFQLVHRAAPSLTLEQEDRQSCCGRPSLDERGPGILPWLHPHMGCLQLIQVGEPFGATPAGFRDRSI